MAAKLVERASRDAPENFVGAFEFRFPNLDRRFLDQLLAGFLWEKQQTGRCNLANQTS